MLLDKEVSGASQPLDSSPAAAPPQSVVPPSSGGPAMNPRTTVLQFLVTLTQRALLPKHWRCLGNSESLRQIPMTPDELEKALRATFSVDELFAANVLRKGAGNTPQFAPVFKESKILVIHDAAGEPVDAISPRGQLLRWAQPFWLFIANLRHEKLYSSAVNCRLLLEDADDMAILNRLGRRFAPAAGLESLGGQNLRALSSVLAARGKPRKFIQTLPAWQIGQCIFEPAPQTIKILQRLTKVLNLLNYDPPPFDVWLPTKKEFNSFREALELRDQNLLGRLFGESLHCSRCSPAEALATIGDRADLDFITARRRLALAISRSSIVPLCAEVAAALAQFRKAFDKLITSGFFRAGSSSVDVWERSRMLLAGENAEQWFENLDLVISARKILLGQFPSVDEDAIEKRQRTTDSFIKLYRLRLPQ